MKSHLVAEEIEIDIGCEIVFAKIVLKNSSPLYVGSFYRPPSDSISSLEALESALTQVTGLYKNNAKASLVIAGDFNAGDIDWELCSVKTGSPKPTICQKVIDIFEDFDLTQMQTLPTRFSANLDLFACNKPSLVKSVKTIPGLSDHDCIAVDMDIEAQVNKRPSHKIYLWSKANWAEMKTDTHNFCETYLKDASARSVDENYTTIEQHLKSMLNTHVPSKMSRTRVDVPWLTQDLKKQCKRKQRLYNKSKKSGKAAHKLAYNQSQKDVQAALKRARWNHINGLLQTGLDEGSSKPFWRYIKQQKQDNVGVSPLKKDGKLYPDSHSRSEILASQFKSVFTDDESDPNRETAPFGPSYPPIDELVISEAGVRALLKGIVPSKASGPDEVPGKLLLELNEELSPVFTS